MDKNEVLLIAQLVQTLQRVVEQLGQAYESRDSERFMALKKEALDLQKKIDASL